MLILRRLIFLCCLGVVAVLTPSANSSAADARTLNGLIDGVFAAHVVKGYVDYPAIARNVRFHKYIEALAEVDLSQLGDDAERMAFWINVYNALAINNRINGIGPRGTLGRLKFFRTTEYTVGKESFDLNEIAERLAQFGDPRVRFALVNTSYSAPDLLSSAYRADQLNQQLEDAARQFINDNRKNRFSDAKRAARLSALFEENATEFGADDSEVMSFVARYVADEAVAKALTDGRYTIEYLDYEWGINGRPMDD